MASPGIMRLKVEFDQDKIQALQVAEARFHEAMTETQKACTAMRDALYDLQNSLTVRKEENG